MNNIDEAYKKILLKIITQEVPGCRIFLFGSRARGTHHSGSDIDVALDAGARIAISSIGRMKEAIEGSNIPFFVDIVDFHAISPEMRQEIIKDGVVWNT
jgi:uncharacterized protein